MEIIQSDWAPQTRHLAIWVTVRHDAWDPEKRDSVFCGWAGGYVPLCNTYLGKTGSFRGARWRLRTRWDRDMPMCLRCRRLADTAAWLAK